MAEMITHSSFATDWLPITIVAAAVAVSVFIAILICKVGLKRKS
ncbi:MULTISPECIES: hypothetical protein [Geobacillus]|nr:MULTISPECIES: hypothetical protein [Geobacillus]KPC97722.1 hypothetical protein LR69_04066 [Geobacillus sp. BCO2]